MKSKHVAILNKHADKLAFIEDWCKRVKQDKFDVGFEIGECGFCRPCLGIQDAVHGYWLEPDRVDFYPPHLYHKNYQMSILYDDEIEPGEEDEYGNCCAFETAFIELYNELQNLDGKYEVYLKRDRDVLGGRVVKIREIHEGDA